MSRVPTPVFQVKATEQSNRRCWQAKDTNIIVEDIATGINISRTMLLAATMRKSIRSIQ
jgi:hypothetical protein